MNVEGIMDKLSLFNYLIGLLFAAFTCYQVVYVFIKIFKKKNEYKTLKLHKYAVVISARNEELVIGNLLESIHEQDYDSKLVDIYVVADNCTDSTAQIARECGATVYERFNKTQVGKGYALTFIFDKIKTEHSDKSYDGYFIFDADNLLDEKYITEMNKVFSHGYSAVTSYRNTKNYGDSWVSAGYGLWFLRESEFLNHPRSEAGVSAALSGTGFLFSDELLEEKGGWNYHMMTEDLEFTADIITSGEKVGYASNAMIYDEQPKGFKQSITQRSRWMKGSMQVMLGYGKKLAKRAAVDGSFSSYDMLMNSLPAILLTVSGIVVNAIMLIYGLASANADMNVFYNSIISAVINSYILVLMLGAMTLITEWKKINCCAWKKILYLFMFPVFVVSFLPATVVALFGNVEWKPIKHTAAIKISEMKKESKKEQI